MEQWKKECNRKEYKWKLEGEWMIEYTHIDMRKTFGHQQARRQLAGAQLPFSSEDLLVVVSLNLIIIFSITLSFRQQRTASEK